MTLPFRAIISDLDGTLLNANHKIGDFTIDTLEQLSKKVLIFFRHRSQSSRCVSDYWESKR